jgi:hypothetical protein
MKKYLEYNMPDDKDKNPSFRVVQHNYKLWAASDYWTVDEAIKYLAAYSLRECEWESQEKADAELNNMSNELTEIVRRSFATKNIEINKVYFPDYDEECGEYNKVNLPSSQVKPKVFIKWAVDKKLEIPDEFLHFVASGNGISGMPEPAKVTDFDYEAADKAIYCPKETLELTAAGTGPDVTAEKMVTTPAPVEPDKIMEPNLSSVLTSDERRRYGQLKLQKDTMDLTIKAAVEAGIYYATLKDGDIFDKDELFKKISDWKYSSISDDSIELIYKALPPKHKRKPGEKKSNDKNK